MEPMSATLESLELTKFLSLVKRAGALATIDASNLTVFAPSDEAVQDYEEDMAERVSTVWDITYNRIWWRGSAQWDVTYSRIWWRMSVQCGT